MRVNLSRDYVVPVKRNHKATVRNVSFLRSDFVGLYHITPRYYLAKVDEP